MQKIFMVFLAVAGMLIDGRAEKVESPDSSIRITVELRDGNPVYSVARNGRKVLGASSLGMGKTDEPSGGWRLESVEEETVAKSWKPVWGKREQVRNHYHELVLGLQRSAGAFSSMEVVFRVYNEGFAFRYRINDSNRKNMRIDTDFSSFNFADDCRVWHYAGEYRPQGPLDLAAANGRLRYPVLLKSENALYVALTEGALYDYMWMDLVSEKGSTELGVSLKGLASSHPLMNGASDMHNAHDVRLPFESPWRVVMLADDPAVFIDSDLLANLNPEPERDFSWVEPGVSFWDWRAWGHKTDDGFRYDLGINSWRRFIDFASETGVPYLLLDANWYGPEHKSLSNPFTGGKAQQVKKALSYAENKGVGLILYLNDAASKNFDIEEIAAAYSEWGAAGIKYGFMKGKGRGKVLKTERIVKACSENNLLVDFHDGPVPPAGHERTWPNWITREYCHSQSDGRRSHSPSTSILQAYVNAIAGPLDMCNGLFDLANSMQERPKIFQQVNSTIVAEAARTLIFYSGLVVVPDSADSYRKHAELFEFIASQKQPWRESRVLAGEFPHYIAVMRKAQDGVYLVGSATDEEARSIDIKLDFLDAGKYDAVIYADAPDAHYKQNREAYTIRKEVVTGDDTIKAKLAPGGGHCIMLKPRKRRAGSPLRPIRITAKTWR